MCLKLKGCKKWRSVVGGCKWAKVIRRGWRVGGDGEKGTGREY